MLLVGSKFLSEKKSTPSLLTESSIPKMILLRNIKTLSSQKKPPHLKPHSLPPQRRTRLKSGLVNKFYGRKTAMQTQRWVVLPNGK